VGKQVADEMLKKHQVDFVAGIIWSNVMLAVAPTVTDAGKFMIGTNAGPHELAGKMCNELFFTTSAERRYARGDGQGDAGPGITDVYVMAPNYAAGKDMVNGFKRSYKGRIVDEVYTRLGQTDYQRSSPSCARRIQSRIRLLSGGMGISFLRQYSEAGLRDSFRCTRCNTVDEISIPAVKHAALGQYETRYWSPDLKNPANQKYVSDYRKKFGKDARLLRSAELRRHPADRFGGARREGQSRGQEGDDRRHEKATSAPRAASSPTHEPFPIQNFYLLKTVTGPAGQDR